MPDAGGESQKFINFSAPIVLFGVSNDANVMVRVKMNIVKFIFIMFWKFVMRLFILVFKPILDGAILSFHF